MATAAVGSAVPLAVVTLMGAPFVSSIRLKLPPNARQSRDAVLRFASNTPPDTLVRVQCIRFAPWLQTRNAYFSDLRKLPFSRWRLANLEHVPPYNATQIDESGLKGLFVRSYFGRFWVNMAQARDRSAVPGAWEAMYQQMPVIGTKMEAQATRAPTGLIAKRAIPAQAAGKSRATRRTKR